MKAKTKKQIAATRKTASRRAAKGLSIVVGSCLASGMALCAHAQEAEADKAADSSASESAEAEPVEMENWTVEASEYSNWVDVGLGSYFVDGDQAQFQRRYGVRGAPFGGVQELHWEKYVTKNSLLRIDGRGIFDNHDYSVRLRLENPDVGFVRVGYREFRTWYDGSGGFFPATGTWLSLYDDELAVDRGQVWFEGGLTLPGKPSFTFKYTHQFRDGQKDSTSWGQTTIPGFGMRNIVPSFRDIDETRDIFQGDLKHNFGNTAVGLGVRYDLSDNNDSLNIRQDPGTANDRYVTDRERVEYDMFNVHAFTETRFNKKVMFSTGYSFSSLDSDLSGSRIYGAGYDPMFDPTFSRRQPLEDAYVNLGGGSQMRQYLMNLNLMWLPLDDLSVIPSIRVQKRDLEGVSNYQDRDVFFGGLDTFSEASDNSLVDVTERLDLRYTGVRDWVLYARGEWVEGQGNLKENQFNQTQGSLVFDRDTDDDRQVQKYTVGANWYPLKRLHLGTEYYHKILDDNYDHLHVQAGPTPPVFPPIYLYPGFITEQDFEVDDVNFRITLRPIDSVTLVSRYDFQLSTIDTAATILSDRQTAEMTSHIFGESLSWTPLPRLFLQASVNYVLDQTDTQAEDLSGGIIAKSKNNYWNGGLLAGYALDNKTDLQAQYFYYRADDFTQDLTAGQPYGAGDEEHAVTVALTRRIRKNLQWTVKYGFFNGRDQAFGGHNDYQAHLVFSSVRYWF